jgi:hypothetical protein
MTVIAFSAARFTPDDLAEFARIADRRLREGRWKAVSRESASGHDRLLIRLPGGGEPLFRLERDATGTYRLSLRDRGAWHPLGEGTAIGDCLAVWGASAA